MFSQNKGQPPGSQVSTKKFHNEEEQRQENIFGEAKETCRLSYLDDELSDDVVV